MISYEELLKALEDATKRLNTASALIEELGNHILEQNDMKGINLILKHLRK